MVTHKRKRDKGQSGKQRGTKHVVQVTRKVFYV